MRYRTGDWFPNAECRRAEIKGGPLHDLRHTAASKIIEAGAEPVTVSKILGHASIQMIMRYAHPMPENMRLAVGRPGDFMGSTRQEVDNPSYVVIGLRSATQIEIAN